MEAFIDQARAVPLPARRGLSVGRDFSAHSLDLSPALGSGLPVFGFDEFRVGAHRFPPHPHAGFSAVTYVFPCSSAGLRSRDSLGNDHRVGPGGMVWMEAGSGAFHEEMATGPGSPLHGLQVFINLPQAHKLTPPRSLRLDAASVPVSTGPGGNQVRVLVGQHAGLASPLQPLQPIRWLDVQLRHELVLDLPPGHWLLAYAAQASCRLLHAGSALALPQGRGLMLEGGGHVALQPVEPSGAQVIVLSGPPVFGPMVGNGPFMMSSHDELVTAVERLRAGAMGWLEPATD